MKAGSCKSYAIPSSSSPRPLSPSSLSSPIVTVWEHLGWTVREEGTPGCELGFLLLAVDHHDRSVVLVAVLRRLGQAGILFKKHSIVDSEPSGQKVRSNGVGGPDLTIVPVVHFHNFLPSWFRITQLVPDSHNSPIKVRAVRPGWDSPAGYTWTQVLPGLRHPPDGLVVFVERLGGRQRW